MCACVCVLVTVGLSELTEVETQLSSSTLCVRVDSVTCASMREKMRVCVCERRLCITQLCLFSE